MGLFGNNEDKREQKAQELLRKYGLEDLSDPRDIESVKKLTYEMAGNKFIELGTLLTGNSADSAKLSCLNAIMQQNFIMIRQLDRIAQKLEK